MTEETSSPERFSWDNVNWEEKQDIQIAEDTGMSRERIRQIRKEGNYPECKYKGRNRETVKFEKSIEHLDLSQLTIKDVAAATGKTTDYVTRTLHSLGKKAKSANSVYNWDTVDWDSKRTSEIARELNTTQNYVSRQKRKYVKREEDSVQEV